MVPGMKPLLMPFMKSGLEEGEAEVNAGEKVILYTVVSSELVNLLSLLELRGRGAFAALELDRLVLLGGGKAVILGRCGVEQELSGPVVGSAKPHARIAVSCSGRRPLSRNLLPKHSARSYQRLSVPTLEGADFEGSEPSR